MKTPELISAELREHRRVLLREAAQSAAGRVPQLQEREFLRQLHELLEDFGAELSYTTADDGIHVSIEGRPLLGGGGFFDRATLRSWLESAGVL
ncbi:hypothetical protein KBY93_12400 [Synechococcus sp. J7-Johnson]|uniref:hypothetical protein n=1 Tax=Synechococcus sp. J7-Johnson TaxID=2823737 RepID=UPI0020CCA247|nr:hypothetical protein [Synechococcus sp. J7-Johnson]MCP9841427.1 hypothetical protein [Synechococcus sp. J7-Johnson]